MSAGPSAAAPFLEVERVTKRFGGTMLGVSYTFWIYAAICATGFLVIWWRLPETKGKTLEEIERELVA